MPAPSNADEAVGRPSKKPRPAFGGSLIGGKVVENLCQWTVGRGPPRHMPHAQPCLHADTVRLYLHSRAQPLSECHSLSTVTDWGCHVMSVRAQMRIGTSD